MIDFSFRLDIVFAQECFLSTYCAPKDNVGKKSHPWKVDEEFCKLGNSADSLKALQLYKKIGSKSFVDYAFVQTIGQIQLDSFASEASHVCF